MNARTRSLIGTLPFVVASRLVAQTTTAPALTLQAVVDATITGNTQIRNDWLRVDSYRGQLIGRAAPFDAQVHTAVQQGHVSEQIQSTQFATQQATTYEVSAARQLRSGITLAPSLQVTRSQIGLPGAPATGLASASLGVAIPLLYDRGGAVSATAERVGQLDLETAMGSWRTSVVSGVNSAVSSYWNYVAAVSRLAAQGEAESRAVRLLERTTQLVEKQERAPADLQQLRANVASKRSARILAEQGVTEARVQLGTVMGIDALRVLDLPSPATDFPVPTADATPNAAALPRLLDSARERRTDLAMQRVGVQAWELELRGYRNGLLPRLDVVMSLGYQGYTEGPGVSHLISPLYRNVPGLNATVQFRYDVSVANSAARGRVMQEQASLEQQRGSLRDVERLVVTDVQTTAIGVDRAALALRESEQAVELFRTTVDNEQRKLQLGVNTLFDVLNAEDALTNAQLTVINNRRTYAVSLASLRVATGTLVDIIAGTPHVDAARLLSTP